MKTARHTCENLIGWRVAPEGERPRSEIYGSRSLAEAIARSERRHTRRRWYVYRVCTCPYRIGDAIPPRFGGANYRVSAARRGGAP
jgi:hypothetical protein